MLRILRSRHRCELSGAAAADAALRKPTRLAVAEHYQRFRSCASAHSTDAGAMPTAGTGKLSGRYPIAITSIAPTTGAAPKRRAKLAPPRHIVFRRHHHRQRQHPREAARPHRIFSKGRTADQGMAASAPTNANEIMRLLNLSPEIQRRLAAEAALELARRSIAGTLAYVVLFLVLVAATRITKTIQSSLRLWAECCL
jgi:hypothetical protein